MRLHRRARISQRSRYLRNRATKKFLLSLSAATAAQSYLGSPLQVSRLEALIGNRFWPFGALARSLKPRAFPWAQRDESGPGKSNTGFSGCGGGPVNSQSSIRSKSSHWRKSPLNPKLSATRKVEIRHRSICLPDFPAVSQVRRYSFRD